MNQHNPDRKRLSPKEQEGREKRIALNNAMELKEEQLFLNLLSLYPNWAALHRELGIFYNRNNNLDAARVHLQRANCLNQESPSALLALSDVFKKQGKKKTAKLLEVKAGQVSRDLVIKRKMKSAKKFKKW